MENCYLQTNFNSCFHRSKEIFVYFFGPHYLIHKDQNRRSLVLPIAHFHGANTNHSFTYGDIILSLLIPFYQKTHANNSFCILPEFKSVKLIPSFCRVGLRGNHGLE